MSRLKIAIVCGGDSSEAEISVDGALFIEKSLDKSKFEPYLVNISKKGWYATINGVRCDVDKNDFSCVVDNNPFKFDFAYINIHGTPGENGILQSYFELISLPYSSSGVDSSAVTFNKYFCKKIAAATGVALAKDIVLYSGQSYNKELIAQELGFPLFIKPNASGSSFGVSKVTTIEQMDAAIAQAFEQSDVVLIEEAIIGREFGQGVAPIAGELTTLPLTEIVSKRDFFDYKAKYEGLSEEITPAEVDDEIGAKIAKIAKEIYLITECRGVSRIDFIVKDSTPYLIEINSVPGMGSSSLIPQQVAATSMSMEQFLTEVIYSLLPKN